jgi:hypothetical protein
MALQGHRVVADGYAADTGPGAFFSASRLTGDRMFADGAERPG